MVAKEIHYVLHCNYFKDFSIWLTGLAGSTKGVVTE